MHGRGAIGGAHTRHGYSAVTRRGASVERNAYDFQSHAHIGAWTAEAGWRVIRSVPIEEMLVFKHSYVTPQRDDVAWRMDMGVDLDNLLHWGREFFKAGS